MISFLYLFLLEFCAAFCVQTNTLINCADITGFMICSKAQERVNWLLEKTKDSMQPLTLNCTQHVLADAALTAYQNRFSKKNNDACNSAAEIFENLLKKYSLTGILPIECEFASGFASSAFSQKKNPVSVFSAFFAMIAVGAF